VLLDSGDPATRRRAFTILLAVALCAVALVDPDRPRVRHVFGQYRSAAAEASAEGEGALRPRPAVVIAYDLGHGLLGRIRLKSFVRCIGVNPGPG
jgi:hypothetical protein